MKDTVPVPDGDGGGFPTISPYTVSDPVQYSTNNCETIWEGTIRVESGKTITVRGEVFFGTVGSGIKGSKQDAQMYLDPVTLTEGRYNYYVNLGNSGVENNQTTYVFHVDHDGNENVQFQVKRGSSQSSYYDTAPC